MVTKVDHGNHRSNNRGNHCSNHSGYYDGYYDAELNFRSRILKFRLRLQKPRSLEAAYKEYKNKKIKILGRSIGATMQKM